MTQSLIPILYDVANGVVFCKKFRYAKNKSDQNGHVANVGRNFSNLRQLV